MTRGGSTHIDYQTVTNVYIMVQAQVLPFGPPVASKMPRKEQVGLAPVLTPADGEVFKAVLIASEAAFRGDWRRCADSYRNGYTKSSNCGELRFNCINGYTSVLMEAHFKATEKDLQFLQRVANDVNAPPMCRARSSFTRGFMLWHSNDREGAKRNYGKAIRIAEGASRTEREHKELFTTERGLHPTSMAPFLDEVLKNANDNLDVLQGRASKLDEQASGVIRKFKFQLAIGPHANHAELDALQRYFDYEKASQECGHCSATSIELSTCAQCKRAWYCSAACQKAAWESHKVDCRKTGKFQQGDLVKITQAPEELRQAHRQAGGWTELDGNILEVVSPVPGKDSGVWNVRIIGGETTFALPSSSFLFYLAVGQRRAIVEASVISKSQRSTSSQQGCGADANTGACHPSSTKTTMKDFLLEGHIKASTCEQARAEACFAPMRVKAGQVGICRHLKLISGFAGFEAWSSLPQNQRLFLLEDIFQVWVEEHPAPLRARVR